MNAKASEVESVVFIGCDSRSGSTLLDHLLSNSDEVTCVGEMSHLSEYLNRTGMGWSWDWVCTCRKHIESCPFWSKMIEEYQKHENRSLREVDTFCKKRYSAKVALILTLLILLSFPKALKKKLLKILYGNKSVQIGQNCLRIYSYVKQTNGGSIILDSSKEPSYLYCLLQAVKRKTQVKVIHLVRDARAVSISKKKRVQQTAGKGSYGYAMLAWVIVNLQLLSLRPFIASDNYLMVSYESLCKNPEAVIQHICKKLNISYEPSMSRPETQQQKHNIGGSQHRFGGFKTITLDEKWKSRMTWKKKILYSILGWPLNKYLMFKLKRQESERFSSTCSW